MWSVKCRSAVDYGYVDIEIVIRRGGSLNERSLRREMFSGRLGVVFVSGLVRLPELAVCIWW